MNLSDLAAQARVQAAAPSAPAAAPSTSSAPGPVAHGSPGAALSLPHPGAPLLAQASPPPALSDYQTELITGRELASLAAKLGRSKSDDKQELSRALFRAIRGEPFAQQGQRNAVAFRLSGEIVEEYPNCDPSTVVTCFAASVSRVQDQGSKMTLDKWESMISRLQDERRARLNMVKGVAGKLGKALTERAAQVTTNLPPSAAELPAAQAARAGGADPSSLNTLLIIADGTYYLRRPDETVYRWKLKSHEALSVELAHQFGTANETVFTHDLSGQPLPISDLVRVYASNAHRIVHDYRSASTTWDPTSATLHVGLPDVLDEPALDNLVHEWLVALAGSDTLATAEQSGDLDRERPVRDLYDWIAATSREHIGHPAAGLVIVGAADAGKGLFATALAATWGTIPVKLSSTVDRFNGPLLNSPFWHADERMPDDLTDAKYRELVQERVRLVEPKGKEKVELRGCGRVVITLNEPEDLRLGGLEGPNALNAVVDRIAYFDCSANEQACKDALDRLRHGPGHAHPHDVDLGRIVRHLRAIQTGLRPRAQRFLGARADRSAARELVIKQGVSKQNGQLIELLIDYLDEPLKWEKSYHVEERQFSTGQRCPLITSAGQLWAWPKELGARMGLRPFEIVGLKRALKAMRSERPREHTFGGRSLRAEFWPVDLDKLMIAASVPEGSELWNRVIAACSSETKDRRPDLYSKKG